MLFGAMAIEWLHVINFRKAETVENVLKSVSNYSKMNIIGSIALVLVLIPGVYMMVVAWTTAMWASIGFIGLLLMGAFSGMITSRKIKQIKKMLPGESTVGPKLKSSLTDNALLFSVKIRTTLLVGIIFLMTVKPDLIGSIITIVVSFALGFVPLKIKGA